MAAKNEVKSALEIALEKTRNLDINPESLKESENIELGKRLGAKLLSNKKGFDIFSELDSKNDAETRQITEGIEFILLANIVLPWAPGSLTESQTSLEAITRFRKNSTSVTEACAQVTQLLRNYERAKEDTLNDLKTSFRHQLNSYQGTDSGSPNIPPDTEPEKLPQFQKELLNQLRQLNAHYEEALVALKKNLKAVH